MARWNSCNVLQVAPDANRLWQFDAKGGGFALKREHSSDRDKNLPSGLTAKSWSSLWQPKLNVAWLPPENVFLRVVELPKSSFGETLAMVELQLEKLSPTPVTQIVWTIEILPQATAENLQTVVVVIAERSAVEEFLGALEGQNFLADRLEAPMLDQLEATPATEDGAWIYPSSGGQSTALVAWRNGGALRNLSFIILPATGERAKSLKGQLAQLVWAGELEGWLTSQPKWHLVADGAAAGEWETFLREGLNEPVQVVKPLPLAELAAHTARRAAESNLNSGTVLLPAEFSARYHQQFVDRLWLRGLFATGILYAIAVVIYFCATFGLSLQTQKVEQQVASISGSYTNTLQLKARAAVLKERQDLKYAALDCWKTVAENLPDGISLERFAFSDGQKLSLAGTATPDQITVLLAFNNAMQKAEKDGQPMFDPEGGDQLRYNQNGDKVTWNFGLVLAHAEVEAKP